jgi:HlyD family secretion protein
MNRRTLIWAGATGAAAVALLVWAFMPRPLQVEVAEARVGHFESSIDEDARTRLRDKFIVAAPLAGQLQRIGLREGDAVEAGAIVATLVPVLSPMLDERALQEQRARVGAAEAGVQRAATRIGAAKVALEQARVGQQRTEQLAKQGFVAATKIDADRLATQAAQKELDTAVESEHVARHELAQARAALGAVLGTGGGARFPLRAPIAGRVLKVHFTSETTVALGAPLLEIGDTSKLEIVAELLTTDALGARPGSAVRIDRWGGPGLLAGRVRRVEPAAFTKVSALGVEEQRVNVLIDIVSAPEQWAALGDGYRVGVHIVTRSLEEALLLPVGAVFPLPAASRPAEARFAVFVFDRGRARLQPVEVGARNSSDAWIQKGLAPGEQVIVYPAAALADGARVSTRGL